jgi:hypothetical protein
MYFIVENTLKTLNDINEAQNRQYFESMNFVLEVNKKLLCVSFTFFAVFVLLSGVIVFPIVIGVQKNKVMILSIYFELPYSEIERVFTKCLYFMAKIESKLDDKNEFKEEAE